MIIDQSYSTYPSTSGIYLGLGLLGTWSGTPSGAAPPGLVGSGSEMIMGVIRQMGFDPQLTSSMGLE